MPTLRAASPLATCERASPPASGCVRSVGKLVETVADHQRLFGLSPDPFEGSTECARVGLPIKSEHDAMTASVSNGCHIGVAG